MMLMSNQEENYEIPRNIEEIFNKLSLFYSHNKSSELLKIIVNAEINIEEGGHYDGLNGGTYGHVIHLTISVALYLSIINDLEKYQEIIGSDLNKFSNVENEYIAKVVFELNPEDSKNWREKSGALLAPIRIVQAENQNRIWGNNKHFKVFLSHKNEYKSDTDKVKNILKPFGISGFVAHKDIEPTKEWQEEIENALFSMDCLVALITENFHKSAWTNQEIGVAIGKEKPIISVNLGTNPKGFSGIFQSLPATWETVGMEIVKFFVKNENLFNTYIFDEYIKSLNNCSSYDTGNFLAEILPSITKLSDEQITKLIDAYSNNAQVNESFGFNGKKSAKYGEGLIFHLKRISDRDFQYSSHNTLIMLKFWKYEPVDDFHPEINHESINELLKICDFPNFNKLKKVLDSLKNYVHLNGDASGMSEDFAKFDISWDQLRILFNLNLLKIKTVDGSYDEYLDLMGELDEIIHTDLGEDVLLWLETNE
jgi:hypothetical protein